MKNKQSLKCYFCGDNATSREHIPAKSLLINYSGLNLLTVPSCSTHNNDKSNLDEIIGLILIKPTILGYKLFTPNTKKTPLRNSITESRIKDFYQHHLFYSGNFKYKNGIIEVISPNLLSELMMYFKLMLAGCYYHHTKLTAWLPKTHHLILLSIYHFIDYPPNIFSTQQDTRDYSVLRELITNSYRIINQKQHIQFEYEIRRMLPLKEISINVDDGRIITVMPNDFLIIATLHTKIIVFGVFSMDKRPFESLNITRTIQPYSPQIMLPRYYKKINHK